MKHIKPTKTWGVVLLAVALLLFIALGVSTIVKHNNKLQFQKVELQDTSAKLKLLQQQYDVQLKSKNVDENKLRDLEKQKEELEKQLAAKQEARRVADAQAAEAQQAAQRLANVVTQTKTAYAAPGGCVTGYTSGDYYLDKIVGYESSGNSCATNPGGCFGLLQACPGAPLRAACGGSPSCQIAWFQANKTGGRSWQQVWQHEQQYGWW